MDWILAGTIVLLNFIIILTIPSSSSKKIKELERRLKALETTPPLS